MSPVQLLHVLLAYVAKNEYFCTVIELNRHIEILLLDNDCVIVPGLGGFMAHHVAARYDATDGLFLPPLRTLGFNPQLKLNDSLLAQSYIEAYDISYPEALLRIEEEVNELKQRLENEGQYELNDIGTLSVNEDGNYVFEPCEAGILTPLLYGLSSFEMKPLAGGSVATAPKVADNNVIPCVLPMPIDGVEKTETEHTETSVEDKNDDDTIKIKVVWVRNAVAIAAAIAAFFIFTTPVSNSNSNAFSMNEVQKSEFMGAVSNAIAPDKDKTLDTKVARVTTTVADTTASVKQTKTEETAKQTDVVSSKRSDSIAIKPAEKDYCIVLASHVPRNNADAYVDKLHSEGYDQAYTYEHNHVVRVVYGHYKDEDTAQKELRKLRDGEYFEQSWIYKKK